MNRKITATATAVWVCALLKCAGASAAELHPIIEVESGYLLGATGGGKWIKAEEAAKAIAVGTTYQVYGLNQPLGEAQEMSAGDVNASPFAQ